MFSELKNLYWFLRASRRPTAKRRYYRYIAKEKKRLLEAGADYECLRLLCRSLAFRHSVHAEKRFQSYRLNCQFCR